MRKRWRRARAGQAFRQRAGCLSSTHIHEQTRLISRGWRGGEQWRLRLERLSMSSKHKKLFTEHCSSREALTTHERTIPIVTRCVVRINASIPPDEVRFRCWNACLVGRSVQDFSCLCMPASSAMKWRATESAARHLIGNYSSTSHVIHQSLVIFPQDTMNKGFRRIFLSLQHCSHVDDEFVHQRIATSVVCCAS